MDDHVVISAVRHGITAYNKRKAYMGWSNPPLLEEALAKITPYEKEDVLVVGSDLKRCEETAKALFPKAPYHSFKEWRELHFGQWEGKTYHELKDNVQYRKWVNHPFTREIPGGEMYTDFKERINQALLYSLNELKKSRKTKLVIVTHGGVIRSLHERFLKENNVFWNLNIGYTEAITWKMTYERVRRDESCISYSEGLLTENVSG